MNDDINTLLNDSCRHYSNNDGAMNVSQIKNQRRLTPLWQFCTTENELHRTFRFNSYAETIEFVNKVASIAEAQDHHPELLVNYNDCKVRYTTHTVKGVTMNDFICAAHIDALRR